MAENVLCQAQFSTGDDGLLDEEALLASTHRPASNLVAGVADGRIRIQSGLLAASVSSTDLCFGLLQGWIVLARELFQLFEGDQRSRGRGLGAAELGKVRLDRRDGAVMVAGVLISLLVRGHGHFLRTD